MEAEDGEEKGHRRGEVQPQTIWDGAAIPPRPERLPVDTGCCHHTVCHPGAYLLYVPVCQAVFPFNPDMLSNTDLGDLTIVDLFRGRSSHSLSPLQCPGPGTMIMCYICFKAVLLHKSDTNGARFLIRLLNLCKKKSANAEKP